MLRFQSYWIILDIYIYIWVIYCHLIDSHGDILWHFMIDLSLTASVQPCTTWLVGRPCTFALGRRHRGWEPPRPKTGPIVATRMRPDPSNDSNDMCVQIWRELWGVSYFFERRLDVSMWISVRCRLVGKCKQLLLRPCQKKLALQAKCIELLLRRQLRRRILVQTRRTELPRLRDTCLV